MLLQCVGAKVGKFGILKVMTIPLVRMVVVLQLALCVVCGGGSVLGMWWLSVYVCGDGGVSKSELENLSEGCFPLSALL